MISNMRNLLDHVEDPELRDKLEELESKNNELKNEWAQMAQLENQEKSLEERNKEYELVKKRLQQQFEDLNLFEEHGSDSQLIEKYPDD